jgi:biotin carboxyl carrier protein
MKYISTVGNEEHVIEIDKEGQITVNDQTFAIDFQRLTDGGLLSLLIDNRSLEAIVEERDDHWEVLIHGELYAVDVKDERAYRLAKARGLSTKATGEASISSPMPGLIVAVPVKEGQKIQKGDQVVILESMKMENELRSPRDGTVTHVYVTTGQSVEKNQILVTVGDNPLKSE